MKTSSWITVDQAREALSNGKGKGIKIAVIDSGIEVSHPDGIDAGLFGMALRHQASIDSRFTLARVD